MFDRRIEEDKMRKSGRLPPGQSLTQKFPVLHYGSVPTFDQLTWDFKIFGEVEKPLTLTWEQFMELPRRQLKMDIHCVTRWSKFDTVWEGVALRDLIDGGMIKLNSASRYVIEYAEHGFTTNEPLSIALADNFLLATHLDGETITPEHGYPVRAVVGAIPGRDDLTDVYFWKGAKWLRGLEFSSTDQPGFWEQAGYHNDADIWKEQRFG
jgi:DMSO/TMAO reductase YedYZ molybdopterin-dependent catalytic subunit